MDVYDTVFDEMKAYVGFTDVDAERLRVFSVHAVPHIPRIVDQFYEIVTAFPDARGVLKGPEQVERLKGTLRQWMLELLEGPHDTAYFERRKRIGRVHVNVGLPSRFMFTAMNRVRQSLCEVAFEELDEGRVRGTIDSVQRVTDLDLGIMTGTYVRTREAVQMERLQELIVANMPVSILLIDSLGMVCAATRPGKSILGPELVGKPWLEAMPAGVVEAADLEALVERAVETGREIELPRVDVTVGQHERHYAITVVPLDGEHIRVLLHIESLTAAVHIEGRLRRAESLAQLGALSAAVAHELRNPLAGMSGALQVITKSLAEEDGRRPIMEKVCAQIVRLDSLVTDLLAFARPHPLRLANVNLAKAARVVCEIVGREFHEVELEVVGEGSAYADAHLVEQIYLNLVRNACLATSGAGRVRVAIDGSTAVVSDDGPGVPEDIRPRLFEPFFTTRTRGTGLGLAISKKSAMEMDGDLVLSIGELPGAAFRLTLPAGRLPA